MDHARARKMSSPSICMHARLKLFLFRYIYDDTYVVIDEFIGLKGEERSMKAAKLTDRVYADTSGEGKGNIGAIELNSYTIVVDSTISTNYAKAFRRTLESQVKAPVRKLVLTHYHSDHTLGIPIFKDCEIIAGSPYKRLKRSARYQPTQTFENLLALEDGGLRVEIALAGGHTKDSLYIYFPSQRALFSGDLIFAKTFFYAGDPTFNPETWMDVLNSFLSLNIVTVIPGHGPVCGREEIVIYARFFESMNSTIEKLVEDGAKEKEVIRYNGFPEFYPEYRKGVRELALANWYKFYKKKCACDQ